MADPTPSLGSHPFPPREPGPAAAAVAAEIGELLLGQAERARAAGLRDLGYLLALAEDEARRCAGLRKG